MQPGQSPDSIDTRFVLRVYAWIATTLGLVFVDGFPFFLTANRADYDLLGLSWGRVGVMRAVAAVVAAFGFTAIGLSRIDDPISRRRALFWFSMGHVVFGVVFLAVSGAMFDQFIPDAFRWTPLTIGIALVYVAVTCAHAPRLPRPFRGLPDNTPGPILIDRARPGTTVDALRSQYEQQIRQAARLEERARLARDLHDAVKQQLFAIQTSAATAQARFSSDAAGAHTALEQVRASARDAMKEMEAMIVSFTFGDDWERPWNAIVAVIAAITVARYTAAWHRVRERGEVLV